MDYLPTFGETWPHSRGNVGIYCLHGAFGVYKWKKWLELITNCTNHSLCLYLSQTAAALAVYYLHICGHAILQQSLTKYILRIWYQLNLTKHTHTHTLTTRCWHKHVCLPSVWTTTNPGGNQPQNSTHGDQLSRQTPSPSPWPKPWTTWSFRPFIEPHVPPFVTIVEKGPTDSKISYISQKKSHQVVNVSDSNDSKVFRGGPGDPGSPNLRMVEPKYLGVLEGWF